MTTRPTFANISQLVGPGHDQLLRLALKLDAAASGALGLLSLAAAPLLPDLLRIPTSLLWPLGLFLVAFAAAVWFVAAGPTINRPAAWTIVAVNLLWVVDSLVAVAAGWLPLTVLGSAFVLLQAAVVALFADLQLLGLRRARPSAERAVA